MIKIKQIAFLIWIMSLSVTSLNAQINVFPVSAASAITNYLVGPGVQTFNPQFTGASVAMGRFTSTTSSMPFTSGLVLSTGDINDIHESASTFAGTGNDSGSDPQLANLVWPNAIKDASVLEFDFIPESDTVKFRYIFASEEYPGFEYDGCVFNDVFGFFISGLNPAGGNYTNKNIALLPGTNSIVSIQSVNHTDHSNLFVDNESSNTLVFNGRTVVLTAWALVVPCTQYHMKLAIGDAVDDNYDSGVFLEANSFTSPRATVTPSYQTEISSGNAIEGCSDVNVTVKLPKIPQSEIWLDYHIAGNATYGVDYTMTPYHPEVLIFPAGQDSVVINIHPLLDNITEPTEVIKFFVNTSLCYPVFDSILVNIINRDTITSSIEGDVLVCDGNNATFTASYTNGLEPIQYFWNNGINTLSQTLTPTDSINTYIFNIVDACNDTETDTIVIIKSYVDISLRSDTTICEGGSVMLYGSGTGVINWTGLVGESPIVTPLETTQYEASVTNICGTANEIVNVYVDYIPTFSLGIDTIVCEQSPIIIGIDPIPDHEYLWSNGYHSSNQQINQPNTYVLQTTNGVCSFSDTIVVGAGFCNWWIPNSFSPDHSGLNEIFKPIGVEIPQYEMIIYNRWGEVIFTTRNWEIGWDGTYLGARVPSGLYFYQIYGETPNSGFKVLIKQDHLSVIR